MKRKKVSYTIKTEFLKLFTFWHDLTVWNALHKQHKCSLSLPQSAFFTLVLNSWRNKDKEVILVSNCDMTMYAAQEIRMNVWVTGASNLALAPELAKSGPRIRIKAEVSGQKNEDGNFHTILSPCYTSWTIVNSTLNILQPMCELVST